MNNNAKATPAFRKAVAPKKTQAAALAAAAGALPAV
jgi:hypothetical protein